MNIFIWPLSFLFILLPFAVYFLLPAKQKKQNTSALKVPFFKQLVALKKTKTSSLKKEKFRTLDFG